MQNIIKLYLRVVETGREFFIRTSVAHRLYILDHGFEHAQDVPIGARMINYKNQVVEVLAVELEPEPELVYNFEVEDAHTYFVGDDAECCVLGHNQDCFIDKTGIGKIANIPQKNLFRYLGAETMIPDKRDMTKWYKWYFPGIVPKNEIPERYHGVFAGSHIIDHCGPNSMKFVGVSGLESCIGVVIYCPNEKIRAGFHFSAADDAYKTIKQYNWPKGAKALIAGGNNEPLSNSLLAEVIKALKDNKVRIEGIVPSSGVQIDRDGKWFVLPFDIISESHFDTIYNTNYRLNTPPKILTIK